VWLGRFQLGQYVIAERTCLSSASTPTLPDRPPLVRVRGSALVLSTEAPIVDRYKTTAVFRLPILLDSRFSTGHYTVHYYYRVSSFHGGGFQDAWDTFEVMPAGDKDGQVSEMYFYQRPHANFVVAGLESGAIFQGRNPSV
jgi:hypothetical protein